MDGTAKSPVDYRLDDQVGFLLRRATQRHLAIFGRMLPSLTPTQFAALAKLAEKGPLSQNLLGRETAMDGATIKGVIDRLTERGLVEARADPGDRRLRMIRLTAEGAALFDECARAGLAISAETVEPLTAAEHAALLRLLARIA